jgi:flagellin
MRAENGAEQSRLNFASTLLTTNQTNLESAISRISDVDVAQETTSLAKWNVLVQAGTSMLTQANQSAQVALKLITG